MAATLQELIEPILDSKGWTLLQLAKRAKISPAGLRKLRDGVVATARGPTVAALARALGVDPALVRAAIAASHAAGRQAE